MDARTSDRLPSIAADRLHRTVDVAVGDLPEGDLRYRPSRPLIRGWSLTERKASRSVSLAPTVSPA